MFADSRAFAEPPSGAERLACLGDRGRRLPTKLSSSPESSSVAGSGIPPSITHRLDSYFVRTKFSIFLEKLVGRSQGKSGVDIRFRRDMPRRKISFPVSIAYVSKIDQ